MLQAKSTAVDCTRQKLVNSLRHSLGCLQFFIKKCFYILQLAADGIICGVIEFDFEDCPQALYFILNFEEIWMRRNSAASDAIE